MLPRRVLHVMNGASGGAALSTLELIAEFRKAGIDSIVVCDDSGTESERKLIRDAVDGRVLFHPLYWWNRKIRARSLWRRPLIELRQWWRTGGGRRSAANVAAIARRHGADLIHTNTSLTPEGGLAARQLGIPHVWHIRELIGPGFPYRFSQEGRAFGDRLASLATIVVANSHVTARAIQRWLPDELLRVVPNGIDLERFTSVAPPSPHKRVVAAMVANMSSRSKKQSLFLQAAALVSADLPIEFRIYGHPPETTSIRAEWQRRLQSLGLSERFRFAGFIVDRVRMMSEIDVLVHTADQESFGRVVVEAMAAARPVVGVRAGGVAETTVDEDTGLLSAPNDPIGLARNIERLATDPVLCRKLGTAGRKRALAEYSVQRCASRMLQVYAEAVSRHSAADKLIRH
jgi:glycosyltransferase involved in cell wall biosynthesis